MSNRTVVEFNHDVWMKIEADRLGFAGAILEMLRGGGTPRAVEALEHYGVTYAGQRHHSDRCAVVYKHHKIEL